MKAKLIAGMVALTLLPAGFPAAPAQAHAYLSPTNICFQDRLADKQGRMTEIWGPGFPTLPQEEMSGLPTVMPLQAYAGGWGFDCSQIFDLTHENGNGYTQQLCAPDSGWGDYPVGPCPKSINGKRRLIYSPVYLSGQKQDHLRSRQN